MAQVESLVNYSTLTRFESDSDSAASLWEVAPYSGVFRFIAAEFPMLTDKEFGFEPAFISSLRKLGPDPTTGVAKLRGLGRVLLLSPLKFHSG